VLKVSGGILSWIPYLILLVVLVIIDRRLYDIRTALREMNERQKAK
jgi:ABC-type uncharacterized transport system permease subunit